MQRQGNGMLGHVVFLILGLLCMSLVAPAAADEKGKRLLDELIRNAKQEGTLDTSVITQVGPAVPKLKAAFNKRFGLDLSINVGLGDQSGKFAQLITALETGASPSFDTLVGSGRDHHAVITKGFATKIDNWETILAEINPTVRSGAVKPGTVSPHPFTGYSMLWGTRTKGLIYNTKMISEKDVPKTYADFTKTEFKGKFPVPPWMDQYYMGILVYDKAKWLKIAEQIGQNAAMVLKFNPALNRILLGEFPFMSMNTYYYWDVKSQDRDAPVGVRFFGDFTALTRVMYIIPKGSRHPAAATLWAMWMTTPEAEAIWQHVTRQENLSFGQSDIDKRGREMLEKSGSKVVSWYDSDETMKELNWLTTTKEGRKYRSAIKRAVTQRK